MFENNEEYSYDFEIVICVRDYQGNPTNKRKNYKTDSASKLASWLYKNSGVSKRRKRKKTAAVGKQEAQELLKKMYKDEEDNTN